MLTEENQNIQFAHLFQLLNLRSHIFHVQFQFLHIHKKKYIILFNN